MKPKRVRGSAFDEVSVQEPLTRNMPNDLLADLTGFRLVHDSEYAEVVRGGGRFDSAQNARVADHYQYDPAYRRDFLGFRLVREDT